MKSNSPHSAGNDITAILGAGGASIRLRRSLRWIGVISIVVLGMNLFLSGRIGHHNQGSHYTTETVSRGNLVVRVSATGTLEPTNQVDVGSELSGLAWISTPGKSANTFAG